MIIIGLTGSIAMGKTQTAKMFKRLNIPVYSADAAVHELYAKKGAAVEPVGRLFPDVVINGEISREKLSQIILEAPETVDTIEKIVHPLVRERENEFISRSQNDGTQLIVLDIPLLFETGAEARVDRIIVVTAPAGIQRQRVLARPGMTEEKFQLILSRQMPDAQKRAKADYIVETHKGLEQAFQQVCAIVDDLTATINDPE